MSERMGISKAMWSTHRGKHCLPSHKGELFFTLTYIFYTYMITLGSQEYCKGDLTTVSKQIVVL